MAENIFKRAKRLQRQHPHKYKIWQDAVKAASKKPRKKKTAKRSASAKKKKKRVGSIQTKSKSHTDYNANKVNISVGSPAVHLNVVKKAYKDQLDSLVLRKFHASTKRNKKKIQKLITAKKAQIRKLS